MIIVTVMATRVTYPIEKEKLPFRERYGWHVINTDCDRKSLGDVNHRNEPEWAVTEPNEPQTPWTGSTETTGIASLTH